MNDRQLAPLCCLLFTACAAPCSAQQAPAPNSVDWGGGYIRYVRDPAGITPATSGGAQRTLPAAAAISASAKAAAAPVAAATKERAVDWGGGYIRYVTDPAGVTKATAGAGEKN